MSTKKKRRIAVRIDMTPMVDIAFLLLIFYMATTQFKPPEARAVDLPESHSQIKLPDKDVINVTLTKLDSMYVDYVEKADIEINGEIVNTTVRRVRKVDLYNLAAEINRARAKNRKALVVVKADKGASFGAMQDIMKQMQENHLERFLILTDKETTAS
ncbi:MAG TPA: biopolymer transporter ExbD [candidate division Zixibacteria bacterium]|nr:biopolymer transporter ExbD [candidate division Zixibacteria bacterium]